MEPSCLNQLTLKQVRTGSHKPFNLLFPFRNAFSTTTPSFSRSACFTATSSSSRWMDWAIRRRLYSRCFIALRILACSRRFVLSSVAVSVCRLPCNEKEQWTPCHRHVLSPHIPIHPSSSSSSCRVDFCVMAVSFDVSQKAEGCVYATFSDRKILRYFTLRYATIRYVAIGCFVYAREKNLQLKW